MVTPEQRCYGGNMSTPTIDAPLTTEQRRDALVQVAGELAKSLGRAPSHADLARAFGVQARTIGRDLRIMAAAGRPVPTTRGDAEMEAAAQRRASMPDVIRGWGPEHHGKAPTQLDLAAHYGVSRRAVQIDLDVLAQEGLVVVERKGRHTRWVRVPD